MKGYQIIVVEDDPAIGELMQKILQREGYTVHLLADGSNLLDVLHTGDLVIMDIMLPGKDGFRLGEQIKTMDLHIPVLFVSARNEIESKLRGLTLGEEYITKPFDPRELLIRIQNLLEHRYGSCTQIGNLFIDIDKKKLYNGGFQNEIILTAMERKLFFFMYENRDRILSKEQFLAFAWQLEDRTPNILNVHIKKLRMKMDDQQGRILENVYGEGYRLNTRIKR
ncbi:response regulator transcription factor [Terribacillus saccharophilus]|uniref:response regulator transcription factor n=1 Tax=Terribacillus saccharophilus TaxID=361277 RepID=UPI00398211EB